jgi:hypothetical protein
MGCGASKTTSKPKQTREEKAAINAMPVSGVVTAADAAKHAAFLSGGDADADAGTDVADANADAGTGNAEAGADEEESTDRGRQFNASLVIASVVYIYILVYIYIAPVSRKRHQTLDLNEFIPGYYKLHT